MKKFLLAIGVVLCGAVATAQTAMSYESVTVAATAIGISSSVYTVSGRNASLCTIATEDAPLRYRYDGTNPTSSEGVLIQSGSYLTLTGFANIKAFRAIRTTAVSATLKITCHAF